MFSAKGEQRLRLSGTPTSASTNSAWQMLPRFRHSRINGISPRNHLANPSGAIIRSHLRFAISAEIAPFWDAGMGRTSTDGPSSSGNLKKDLRIALQNSNELSNAPKSVKGQVRSYAGRTSNSNPSAVRLIIQT